MNRALSSFTTCLVLHGVKLPSGAAASGLSLKGVDTKSPAYRGALRACIPVVNAALKAATGKHPGAASPSPGAARTSRSPLPAVKVPAAVTAIMTSFTVCMRKNGVAGFPEPTGASFDLAGTNIDSHTPAYKSAEAKCNPVLQALDPTG